MRVKVQFAMLVHLQANVLLFDRSESLRLDPDGVVSDGQQGHEVMSGVIGFGLAGKARPLCGRLYGCPGDHRASFIRDSAGKAACGLAVQKRTDGKYQRTEERRAAPSWSASKSPHAVPGSSGAWDTAFPTKSKLLITSDDTRTRSPHSRLFVSRFTNFEVDWLLLSSRTTDQLGISNLIPRSGAQNDTAIRPASVNRNAVTLNV